MVSRICNNRFWFRGIVLHTFSRSAADPCLQSQVQHTAFWHVYMERSCDWATAERVLLESELRIWFGKQGVSEVGASRAVQLLDASSLLAEPRPSRWNRRGNFGVQERCHYLWYRHAARILGWCERRRFPDNMTGFLRGHVFPTQCGRHEATRADGPGKVTAGAPAGSIAIDTHRRATGSSSCTWTHHICHDSQDVRGCLGFGVARICWC
jgi:hypothetical protein